MRKLFLFCLLGVGLATLSIAQDLSKFEEKVTEFRLENGLRFIVIERHEAPVASFVTYVDVGAANEPIGKSGIAHIFEHMVFKGSTYIGTTNAEAEKAAIKTMDAAYQAWLDEKYKVNSDEAKLSQLWDEFKKSGVEAKVYVVNNEFSEIINRNGGVGLNASTGYDQTMYYYSLPSNKTELWFSLEAERFKDPVYREFYVEKDVVKEERRMRTDSSPIGRLIEEFLSVSYTAHPYGINAIGWPSDIEATTIADLEEFYAANYVLSNYVIAIAGDVNPEQIKTYAKRYFGDIPAGTAPKLTIKEPGQRGERRFTLIEKGQPWYLAGYHTVSVNHEDAISLEVLSSVLSSGRTSRLYKRMVENDKTALTVGAFNGFPGNKYDSMFLTFVIPNQGVNLDDVENTLEEEIQRIKNGDVTQSELDRVITNARAGLIRRLNSNNGLAVALAQATAIRGDWRSIFNDIENYKNVTVEDLQRVANTYLIPINRTVGKIINEEASASATSAQ